MPDEPRSPLPSEPSNSALVGLLQIVDDHIGASERRVMTAIGNVQSDLKDYETDHAALHADGLSAQRVKNEVFERFIHRAELAAARKDGFLGVFRFLVDLLGRNWRLIALLLTGLGVSLGNIHISFGLFGQ